MNGLQAYFELTGDRRALAAVAPGLSVEGSTALRAPTARGFERSDLAASGFTAFAALDAADALRLEEAIGRVRAAGLPATFVYAFAEPWALGDEVARRVSDGLGAQYALLDDAWAFEVAPGTSGWAPHRGMHHVVFDRAAPEVLNTWVAVTDAPVERACMHAVAFDDDPAYPHDLASVVVPDAAQRPLPVARGVALAWNANLLHWGGPCAPSAAGPRMSLTFTLVREDAAGPLGFDRRVVRRPLSFDERVALVAAQIRTYGEGQHDVSPDARAWALALGRLETLAGRGLGPP